MDSVTIKFAETSESASGLGAFNINIRSFLFQLITFVIVLLILGKWVFPRIISTLESRRQALEESLVKAKQTEETLAQAETTASQIVHSARQQADKLLTEAAASAKDILAKAEAAAEQNTKRLIAEAEQRANQERLKLREELKSELTDLVVLTSEKVMRRQLTEQEDRRLVEEAVREVGA